MKLLSLHRNYPVAVSALFLAAVLANTCFCKSLSLYGIVPVAGKANGKGWTMGFQAGGFVTGNDVNIYAGYWNPILPKGGLPPQIATNALIFPSADSVIFASHPTNIAWDVEKITDDIDGTNLTISRITLHYADTTNYIVEVTNNIDNTLGAIQWDVPAGSWDGETNYVLKFEVVDSTSLTSSMVFSDNKFALVPEGGIVIAYLLSVIGIWRKFIPND